MSGLPVVGTDGRELKGRGQRTRARLLEAATLVLASRGLHGTRVQDIVSAAATSHGTFYRYFDSKEAVFDELVGAVAAEFEGLAASLPPIGADAPAQAALKAWLEQFVGLYERHGRILQVWTESELAGEPAGAAGDRILGSLAAALVRQVRRSDSSGLDDVVAPLTLITMMERLNYYVATRQVRAGRDDVVEVLLQVLTSAATPR